MCRAYGIIRMLIFYYFVATGICRPHHDESAHIVDDNHLCQDSGQFVSPVTLIALGAFLANVIRELNSALTFLLDRRTQ